MHALAADPCPLNRNCVIPQAFLIYSGDRPYGQSPMTQVCKPGSVLTAIYLVPQLLTGSSRLLGTVGPTYCSSTALLRIEFAAPQCLHEASALLPHFFTLTALAGSGISLLYLSWGHPRRALPVILALWSPDFPHLGPVGGPAAAVRPGRLLLYCKQAHLSKNFIIFLK